MQNDKTKKTLGIIWFLLFIYFIFSLGRGSSQARFSITDYLKTKWTQIIQYLPGKSSGGVNSLIKQQVVQEESEVIDVVEKVSPSVVSVVAKTIDFDIYTGPSRQESGIGTGFIVDSSGLIVTNSHVVDNTDAKYSVVLKDNKTYDVSKVYLDANHDLAILKIDAQNLPVVSFGDSDSLKVGQKAIAIGNALGEFQNTVTVGVVSGIARHISAGDGYSRNTKVYESVIQTDAALNPGNSGGPLLNSAGQVIGINVATTPGADNISFAIPVNALKPVLEGFLKEGRIVTPYIGVRYGMVSKVNSALYKLPVGAYVSEVLADSPAAKAGLQKGDIIISVNGKTFDDDMSTLATFVSKYKVGDTVDLIVDRDGAKKSFKVTLKEVPVVVPDRVIR